MSTSSVCCSPQQQGSLEPLLHGKFEATAFGEEVSESPSPMSRLAPKHEHEGIEGTLNVGPGVLPSDAFVYACSVNAAECPLGMIALLRCFMCHP